MNPSCQCSKPMTNAAGFCARCGRSVRQATGNPPSVLLCKPEEIDRVRGLAELAVERVHVDEAGRVWLPPVNATPPDLDLTIGLAETDPRPEKCPACGAGPNPDGSFTVVFNGPACKECARRDLEWSRRLGRKMAEQRELSILAATGPAQDCGDVSRRGDHGDIVVTAGCRVTSEYTPDGIVALLEAMTNGHRQMALAAIKKRFELTEVSDRLLKLEEDTNCNTREILALLRSGRITI
jgi:hypothetical protein